MDGLSLPLIAKILIKRQRGVHGNRANHPRRKKTYHGGIEHTEKKMASINNMKFDFSEPAPDDDPGNPVVRHSA